MIDAPTIEILYFDGCPSHERLLPAVRRIAAETGAKLRMRAVVTPDAADALRFLGSPSVRVDGRDVEPGADQRVDFGMKCRIYRFDGMQSPTPPEQWIRAALDRRASREGSGA